MIHCHFMSPFSPILAGKHSFSLMPPWCLPVHMLTVGNVSPQKPCRCFTNTYQHIYTPQISAGANVGKLIGWQCAEEELFIAVPAVLSRGNREQSGDRTSPWLSSLPPSGLSHFEAQRKRRDSPAVCVTPLWESLATLVGAHQPQQAAVLCLQWKNTLGMLLTGQLTQILEHFNGVQQR